MMIFFAPVFRIQLPRASCFFVCAADFVPELYNGRVRHTLSREDSLRYFCIANRQADLVGRALIPVMRQELEEHSLRGRAGLPRKGGSEFLRREPQSHPPLIRGHERSTRLPVPGEAVPERTSRPRIMLKLPCKRGSCEAVVTLTRKTNVTNIKEDKVAKKALRYGGGREARRGQCG